MRNKAEERRVMAQGRSLKRTGQAMWVFAVIVAALLAYTVFAIASFIREDAIRVERTLRNNE